MISLNTKRQNILLHRAGVTNRQIAIQLGKDKNTVSHYVNEHDRKLRELLERDPDQDPDALSAAIMEEAPSYNTGSRKPTVATEEAVREIRNCLAENERRLHATDIHRYLTEEKGYRISYSTVKRLVHACNNPETAGSSV